jgi:hypothetical protein
MTNGHCDAALALIFELVPHIIRGIAFYLNCQPRCGSRLPPSPTLSAQEGELDNLLIEPSGGWDDETSTQQRYRPQSIKYGKEELMAVRPRSQGPVVKATGSTMEGGSKGERTWVAGKSMEELEREEAELAKMDRPPRDTDTDEFGDFEQAPDWNQDEGP